MRANRVQRTRLLSDEEFVRLEDPDPMLTKRHRLYITLWALPSAHMAAGTREVI